MLLRKRRNFEKVCKNRLSRCGETTCGEETRVPMESSRRGVSRGCGRSKCLGDKDLRSAAGGGRGRAGWRGAENNGAKRPRPDRDLWRKALQNNKFRRPVGRPGRGIVAPRHAKADNNGSSAICVHTAELIRSTPRRVRWSPFRPVRAWRSAG